MAKHIFEGEVIKPSPPEDPIEEAIKASEEAMEAAAEEPELGPDDPEPELDPLEAAPGGGMELPTEPDESPDDIVTVTFTHTGQMLCSDGTRCMQGESGPLTRRIADLIVGRGHAKYV